MSATVPGQSGVAMPGHTERGSAGTPVPPAARWYARLSLLLGVATLVFILIGGLKSIGTLIVGLVGMALALVGAWEFLRRVGAARWIGAAVAIAAPIAVLVLFIVKHVLWEVLVALALFAAASWAARQSLAHTAPDTKMPESESTPPSRSFLVMNPRSGGGKVGKFSIDSKATALGANVQLLEGPGVVDVAALARQAVDDGADLLGVAGGDGTQALVAGIAAQHDLPFLVISAGTRNHFAMDLGLDRDRPDQGLEALTDGVEVCLDLGDINGRTFVNNASFGAYAEIVQSPAYRDDKAGTTLQMLPELLSGRRGPQLRVVIDGAPHDREPAGSAHQQQPVRDGRSGRDGTQDPHRRRRARCAGHPRRQRWTSSEIGSGSARRSPLPRRGARSRHRGGHTDDPSRHRR